MLHSDNGFEFISNKIKKVFISYFKFQISYNSFTSKHHSFLTAISSINMSSTFWEAMKHAKWRETMENIIIAFYSKCFVD